MRKPSALARLSEWVLGHRYPAAPVALGLLLAVPSLWVGLQTDDFLIRAAVLGLEAPGRSAWKPFSFLDGDPARFWALGLLLSLLPVCTTFPHDRLLTFTSKGVAAFAPPQVGETVDVPSPLE